MDGLTEHTAADWLHARGWLPAAVGARVRTLEWGVSNVVLRVTPGTGADFILKQSRPQLRTPIPWFSRIDRIYREAEALRAIREVVPAATVPEVLWEDRPEYVFAMEAAADPHTVWKQELLSGELDRGVARQLGEWLGRMHRQTAGRAGLREQFGDLEVFQQLRVDPFYRRVAAAHPDLAAHWTALIDGALSHAVCLVHGDFSPKNVLLVGRQLFLVDFETVHFGDPAFDTGFFLSHLLLKTLYHQARFAEMAELGIAFWEGYQAQLGEGRVPAELDPRQVVSRTLPHLAGCMLARVDGTSRVDYLPAAGQQQAVREFCRQLLQDPPREWAEVLRRLRESAQRHSG
ncbi:MAG: phosphotransferase family protein [Planctomycetaceae bacterium]